MRRRVKWTMALALAGVCVAGYHGQAAVYVIPASQSAVIKTAHPATNYNGALLMQECDFNAYGSALIGGMIMANFDLHSYSGWVAVADGSFSNGINWAAEGAYYGSHQ